MQNICNYKNSAVSLHRKTDGEIAQLVRASDS